MAVQDYFESPVAYNPDADQLVAGAAFQVFAITDTALTTPLIPLDPVSGVPIAVLRSSSIGVLPAFRVAGDPAQVILRSGSFTTLVTSKYGIFLDVVPDPDVLTQAIDSAALAETAAAAAAEAATAAQAVGNTNDGIIAGRINDPASMSRQAINGAGVDVISNAFGRLATKDGVIANGTTDNTTAMQAAIDAAIAAGVPLVVPPGTIVTGPLDLNGTGHSEPANAQWPGITALHGAGQRRTVFKAKPGAFLAGEAVLKLRNVAGATIRDFMVDANNVADIGVDFQWVGGNSGNPAIAPSPRNNYQNIWLEKALVTNGILGQQNDSKISNVRSGPCAGTVGLSILAAGGLVTMDNVVVTQGLFEIACQNAQLSQCAFFNGVRLAGASFNHINWGGSHIYGNPTSGVTIESTATGNATRGMVFEGAFFPTTTTVVAGRFHQGIIFIACQFNNYTSVIGTITPAGGSGAVPIFDFQHCSFAGALPGSADGQYGSRGKDCRNSTGSIVQWETWRTYTPTWNAGGVAVMLGAGSINARFVWRGQEVHARIEIVLAADTVVPAGAWTISVPRTASASGRGLGTMWMFDSSASANHVGMVRINGNSAVANLIHINPAANNGLVDSANPFAWATADRLVIDVVYEVA